MPTFIYPGSANGGATTYVPNFEASGKMVIGFSRNPATFALNQYVTLVPVKQSVGYYLLRAVSNAGRLTTATQTPGGVLGSPNSDRVWSDGNDMPDGSDNLEGHSYQKFLTERYAFAGRLGYKAVDQADWNILAAHSADLAQQAMTARTAVVASIVESSTSYAASLTSSATSLVGDFIINGTQSNPLLKAALQKIGIAINKATWGVVKPSQLVARMSPDLAEPLSRTQEVHTYLKESPFALAQIRGDVKSQNGEWGLPDTLYNFKLAIEDCVYNPAKKGYPAEPQALSYIASSNFMAVLARPGSLVGVQGAPSFSAVHLWVYEEMTVESKDDPDNRRHNFRVVDDIGVNLVSQQSAYGLTNCQS